MLLTSDRSLPRSSEGIGILIRSIVAFASGRADDELKNDCQYLPPV